jgi:UDP-N-acetylglucosamine:LPS N-acetylglucosamine transferase
MYGILAAGQPIVAVTPEKTDAAALGAQLGFGVSADPDKPEKLVAAVRALLADPSRLETMATAARAAAPRPMIEWTKIRKFMHIIEEAGPA